MQKVIVGIHGLSNKPPADVLARGWEDSIVEGLIKNSVLPKQQSLKPSLTATTDFQSVYWADVMYPEPDTEPELHEPYRPAGVGDIKRYQDNGLDDLLALGLGLGGTIIDEVKELLGLTDFAMAVLKSKLPDLYRYYTDHDIRDELQERLIGTLLDNQGRSIMVVAHSMGSIIAYDVLRKIGKDMDFSIDHFVTIGSPLGLPHVKYMICQGNPTVRTPSIVRRWTNLADRRDPVAMDVHLRDDYEANSVGVRVVDDLVMNDWGGIFHKSYGYLRCPEFTDLVRGFI